MSTVKEMTGQRFGRLVVTHRAPDRMLSSGRRIVSWFVRCDCGQIKDVMAQDLRRGDTKSCGCFREDVKGDSRRSHGMSSSRTYRIWRNMLTRCENPKATHYASYGGRGITVCERWKSFENFLEDMGKAPDSMSIDRVDNSKGYCLENCRWATNFEQRLNQRLRQANKTGVSGINCRHDSGAFRAVIYRRDVKILDVTTLDFFEACCLVKSIEAKEALDARNIQGQTSTQDGSHHE